jgi:hypothetical protein
MQKELIQNQTNAKKELAAQQVAMNERVMNLGAAQHQTIIAVQLQKQQQLANFMTSNQLDVQGQASGMASAGMASTNNITNAMSTNNLATNAMDTNNVATDMT